MFDTLNERVKKMTVVDIGLVKFAVLFTTIIIVKLIPQLLEINFTILIILVIAASARPVYKMWIKK